MTRQPKPDDAGKDCPECGADVNVYFGGAECTECDWATSHKIEAPEGGWPRGSDMDRI